MSTISFVNQKGGSGKSTFCINTAIRLKEMGAEVMVINCDTQDSIGAFLQNRSIGNCFLNTTLRGDKIAETLKSLIKKYEFILIDTAGSDSVINYKMAIFSDLVIMPTKPSQLDLDVLQKNFIKIQDCLDLNEDLKVAVVINQLGTNPRLLERKITKEFINELISDNPRIDLMDSVIHERIAYKRAIADGFGISEYVDRTCSDEFELFFQELILKYIN